MFFSPFNNMSNERLQRVAVLGHGINKNIFLQPIIFIDEFI